MNTLLHALKSPNIQGVLLGDLITHIRASLKRLHFGGIANHGSVVC